MYQKRYGAHKQQYFALIMFKIPNSIQEIKNYTSAKIANKKETIVHCLLWYSTIKIKARIHRTRSKSLKALRRVFLNVPCALPGLIAGNNFKSICKLTLESTLWRKGGGRNYWQNQAKHAYSQQNPIVILSSKCSMNSQKQNCSKKLLFWEASWIIFGCTATVQHQLGQQQTTHYMQIYNEDPVRFFKKCKAVLGGCNFERWEESEKNRRPLRFFSSKQPTQAEFANMLFQMCISLLTLFKCY